MQTIKKAEANGLTILNRLETDSAMRDNFFSFIDRALNFIDESKAPDFLRLPVYKSQKHAKKDRNKQKEKDKNKEKEKNKDKDKNKDKNKEKDKEKEPLINDRLALQLTGHHDWIWNIILSRHGSRLFSCSADHSVSVWRLQDNNYIKENIGFHEGVVYDLALLRDETILISSGKDKYIRLWDTEAKTNLRNIQIDSEGFVIQLSLDEKTLFVGTVQGVIKSIDLTSGQISDFSQAHGSVIRKLLVTDDGRLISCSQDKLIRIWDIKSKKPLFTLSGHTKEVFTLALSKNKKILYSAGNENLIYVWNLTSQMLEKTIETEKEVSDLVLAGNQYELYAGLVDGVIALLDLNGQRTKHLRGHTDRITRLRLFEDETGLISASRDKTICIWNTNTVTTSAKYFNFVVNSTSLGSFMLDRQSHIDHKISFHAAPTRPLNYTLRLSDDHDKEIFRLRFAPHSKSKEPSMQVNPASKMIKVRLEYADEFEVPLSQLLENKDIFSNFNYTNRIDDFQNTEYLSLSRVNKCKTVSFDKLKELIGSIENEPDTVDNLVSNFDVDSEFAKQLKTLINAALGERRLSEPQSELFQLRLQGVYNHLDRLETAYQQVFKVNEDFKQLFSHASFSFKDYASVFDNLIVEKQLIDRNKQYIETVNDKNFIGDLKFLSGNVVNGKIDGFSCKVENHTKVLKGRFKQGYLNGIGSILTADYVMTGRFKNDDLEAKPFYQIEKNGIIRIGDSQGLIRTIIKNKVAFQAEHITESYNGPAHISFKSTSRFTGVIDKLELIEDVVNEHIVMYYGEEGKSYITKLDKDAQTLVYNEKIKFRISWEQGTLTKIEL